MSKKRKRDLAEVDVELVQVYDLLAHEDVSERIKAAHKLVSQIYRPDSTSAEQTKTILTRLFRGLCSSRKAARHGFAIALTELLARVPIEETPSETALAESSVIDILVRQTSSDGNASGQDERDHYFGRLFGADAVIQSGVLFQHQRLEQWNRLLEVLCSIALKKPWLRQECGWIMYNFIARSSEKSKEQYVLAIVEVLHSQKLIRTPEGVAIWVLAAKSYPDAKLPNHVWKHGSPLAAKDVRSLAEVLKNVPKQSEENGETFDAQGPSVWSASLHFVWSCVLSELFAETHASTTVTNGNHNKHDKETISFQEFWQTVVDDGFFSPESSTERKHTGLLILTLALESAPISFINCLFTKNAMHCLITTLRGEDAYLKKHARKVLQTITTRSTSEQHNSGGNAIAAQCIEALLKSVGYADFDQLTKTKTIETVIQKSLSSADAIFETLVKLFHEIDVTEQSKLLQHQRYLVALQGRVLDTTLRSLPPRVTQTDETSEPTSALPLKIINHWIRLAYFAGDLTDQARAIIKERLSAGFEQCLRTGLNSVQVLVESVMHIHKLQTEELPLAIKFDKRVSSQVEQAFTNLKKARKRIQRDAQPNNNEKRETKTAFVEGIVLLYCVVLIEIFNGEAEAVEVLADLLAQGDDLWKRKKLSVKGSEEEENPVDLLIETLLSFVARPSKFMRRVSLLIFESMASQITLNGLQSLIRVLSTKENAQGQQEMFEDELAIDGISEGDSDEDEDDDDDDDDEETGSEADSDASDVEMIDSDVEVVSADDSDDETSSDTSSQTSEDVPDGDDDELAAFDAALASALGSGKGPNGAQDASVSDSDEDMNDDEMMALDEKLTEVFRARKQATSKKKDRQGAKEAVVNFKNRVLDLIEAYLRQEYLNPLALELIVPLLRTARTTQTKQLADRCCNALRDYCGRCKGQNSIPRLHADNAESLKKAVDHLKTVHKEARMDTSNTHSAVASNSSLLLAKTLLHAGAKARVVIDVYGDTREKQLTDPSCKVQPAFFNDWNNWCAQARTQQANRQ